MLKNCDNQFQFGQNTSSATRRVARNFIRAGENNLVSTSKYFHAPCF